MDLPSWVSAEEDKPAPMPLLRVQAFVNTLDVDQGTDVMREPDGASAWLAQAGLLAPSVKLGGEDLELARDVRDAIRALLRSNGGEGERAAMSCARCASSPKVTRPPSTWSRSVRLARRRRQRARGRRSARPPADDPRRASRRHVVTTQVCANPECEWAFYDRSRNRQGAWCTMASCGNRLKNRRFRARHASQSGY